MKLSELKEAAAGIDQLHFLLPDGSSVPSHYHVTEVGYVTKNFIDCGGTVREEKVVNFQLWYSDDLDHRLRPDRLLSIVSIFEKTFGAEDHDIEVEYQADTIGKYGLSFQDGAFHLTNKMTACLAPDKCDVPQKKKVDLSDLVMGGAACTPGGGCC